MWVWLRRKWRGTHMPVAIGEAERVNKEVHVRLAIAREREIRVNERTDQLAEAFRRALGGAK